MNDFNLASESRSKNSAKSCPIVPQITWFHILIRYFLCVVLVVRPKKIVSLTMRISHASIGETRLHISLLSHLSFPSQAVQVAWS